MKKIRTAVIGQGRSGRDIHGAFFHTEANQWYDIVAVVELDPARRELALKEYPGCTVYENYKDLYGRDDIDLVVNATYSEMHYPVTLDLLENGFNVLVEKPFGRNQYECDNLIRVAKNKGVTLAVFQQTFLAPYYRFAKELSASDKLGNLTQISIMYNGFARRWDWQTLQCKMAGCLYNTGPHPIGMALGFLDFDPLAEVKFSRLADANSAGDAEDYAKVIITAPGKPVIDVEINPTDCYPQTTIKICGSKGTFKCNSKTYDMKYIVEGEYPERQVIFESLKKENGNPAYCSEKLPFHEESGEFAGDAFNSAVCEFYKQLYAKLVDGTPLQVTPEMASRIINVIDKVHTDNPMPVLY